MRIDTLYTASVPHLLCVLGSAWCLDSADRATSVMSAIACALSQHDVRGSVDEASNVW